MLWVLLLIAALALTVAALVVGSRTAPKPPPDADWMRYADPHYGPPGGIDGPTDGG